MISFGQLIVLLEIRNARIGTLIERSLPTAKVRPQPDDQRRAERQAQPPRFTEFVHEGFGVFREYLGLRSRAG